MSGPKLVVTLLTLFIHLSVTSITLSNVNREYMTSVPYASAIQSLMYVIICTRLDFT